MRIDGWAVPVGIAILFFIVLAGYFSGRGSALTQPLPLPPTCRNGYVEIQARTQSRGWVDVCVPGYELRGD